MGARRAVGPMPLPKSERLSDEVLAEGIEPIPAGGRAQQLEENLARIAG